MKKSMLVLLMLICLPLAGCGVFNSSSSEEGGSAAAAAEGRYWDFDDVLVPSSMKLEKDKSMIFTAEGRLKGGLLVFSDNLSMNSLVNFFAVNMSKDGWLQKSAFKYPNVAMFFAKPDKTCVIHVTESTFSTTVAVWVAPAAGARP